MDISKKLGKNAQAIELMAFVIIGIVVVVIFAMFIYGFNLLNTTLSNGEMDTSAVNLTRATNATFSHLNTGVGGLRLIAAIILIGYMIASFIFAYFSSKHPLWLFVYILITGMIVVFSVYIANAYDDLKANAVLGGTISSFGITNFIISNLPIWTTIIGLFGIVLSIIGIYARRALEQ